MARAVAAWEGQRGHGTGPEALTAPPTVQSWVSCSRQRMGRRKPAFLVPVPSERTWPGAPWRSPWAPLSHCHGSLLHALGGPFRPGFCQALCEWADWGCPCSSFLPSPCPGVLFRRDRCWKFHPPVTPGVRGGIGHGATRPQAMEGREKGRSLQCFPPVRVSVSVHNLMPRTRLFCPALDGTPSCSRGAPRGETVSGMPEGLGRALGVLVWSGGIREGEAWEVTGQ